MKKNKSNIIVYLYSTLTILLWGLSYIWNSQLISKGIPVEYFVYIRVFFAGSILLILNLAMGIDIKIKPKDLSKFLLLALCEPFIYFVCETYGIYFTESPTYSAMIIATTPIAAMFAGFFFFKEKLSLMNIAGMLVCIGGIVLMSMTSSGIGDKFLLGAILLFVAVIAEAGQASCTKWLAGNYKPTVITMHQFLIGGVYLAPLFFTKGLRNFDPAIYLSWDVWRPIFCLAILCSCVCFTLWVSSIKHLGVAKSSVMQAFIPVITALSGMILGSELLTPIQWLGIMIASLGVTFSQITRSEKKVRGN